MSVPIKDVLNFNPEDGDSGSLFTTKCSTIEDKYRLLESRDKALKARNPKARMRVEEATRLFGTCQDMCPEKERYMRQYQHTVDQFERVESSTSSYDAVIDHKKAVKAYSRSSADQEEPLPHELRPAPILDMTMNYLLHNIVPLAEEDEDLLGDWYNFLWDRTRSIRKDITQQQLTDLTVVGLMEKCARFHIHCASRLCELEMRQFDSKLNDDNLVKCLTSLQHMYEDLRRRGITCQNEPEFRAYQIIMQFGKGDVISEVQEWSNSIRNSWLVKAALFAERCIFAKNFSGFFRLVKSLPYMFSCILHRYFYDMRYYGLTALCESSFRGKTNVQIKFSKAQKLLGFGDQGQSLVFKDFCEQHGLAVNLNRDRIQFTRENRIELSTSDGRRGLQYRESFIIESKLTTSTAEAINGAPLPENPLLSYEPQDSFDEEGYMKGGLVAGIGSDEGLPVFPSSRPPPPAFVTIMKPPPPPPAYVSRARAVRGESKVDGPFRVITGVKKTTPRPNFSFGAPPSASTLTPSSAFGSFALKAATSTTQPSFNLFATATSETANSTTSSMSIFGGLPKPSVTPSSEVTSDLSKPAVPGFASSFHQIPFGGGTGTDPSVFTSFRFTGQSTASVDRNILPLAEVEERDRELKLLKAKAAEEEKRHRYLEIDRACEEVASKILHGATDNLTMSEIVNPVVEEQQNILKQEEIRSKYCAEYTENFLNTAVDSMARDVASEVDERHRKIEYFCIDAVNKWLNPEVESMFSGGIRGMCQDVIMSNRKEWAHRMKLGLGILNRTIGKSRLRLWHHKAAAKRRERERKQEELLQWFREAPALFYVGKSAKEKLQQLRGNRPSPPNMSKVPRMTVSSILDQRKRAEAVAMSFSRSVTQFESESLKRKSNEMTEHLPKSVANMTTFSTPPQPEKRTRWYSPQKRKMSSLGTPTFRRIAPLPHQNEMTTSKKQPIPESMRADTSASGSSVTDLLAKMKRFAEDTKKEKESFLRSLDETEKLYSTITSITPVLPSNTFNSED